MFDTWPAPPDLIIPHKQTHANVRLTFKMLFLSELIKSKNVSGESAGYSCLGLIRGKVAQEGRREFSRLLGLKKTGINLEGQFQRGERDKTWPTWLFALPSRLLFFSSGR